MSFVALLQEDVVTFKVAEAYVINGCNLWQVGGGGGRRRES